MNRLLLFALISIPIIIISWKPLMKPKSHGFYRFFGWEGTLWLFCSNYLYWFTEPLAIWQIISWLLLAVSVYYVVAGILELKKRGKPKEHREDDALYNFEKTTELVETGLYRYVRHPLYGSLIFLSWGICLKNPVTELIIVSLLATVFYYITARLDERECTVYFGEQYPEYMKKSKMFVPFFI